MLTMTSINLILNWQDQDKKLISQWTIIYQIGMNGPIVMFLGPFLMFLNNLDEYLALTYSDIYNNTGLFIFVKKW